MLKFLPTLLLQFFFITTTYAQAPVINLQKNFGGSNTDFGQFIIPAIDGNIIVIGASYSSDGNITGAHGGSDIWVSKISAIAQYFGNEHLAAVLMKLR
jgi:hypothetical protein